MGKVLVYRFYRRRSRSKILRMKCSYVKLRNLKLFRRIRSLQRAKFQTSLSLRGAETSQHKDPRWESQNPTKTTKAKLTLINIIKLNSKRSTFLAEKVRCFAVRKSENRTRQLTSLKMVHFLQLLSKNLPIKSWWTGLTRPTKQWHASIRSGMWKCEIPKT